MARPTTGKGWFAFHRRRLSSTQMLFRWYDAGRQRTWYVGTLRDGATPVEVEDLLLARVEGLKWETPEDMTYSCQLLHALILAPKNWGEVFGDSNEN